MLQHPTYYLKGLLGKGEIRDNRRSENLYAPTRTSNKRIATYHFSDVSGPSTAQTALLVVYDIFGYFPQTIQGADILATSDKDHPYQVFMPDFFEGVPCDTAWYTTSMACKSRLD